MTLDRLAVPTMNTDVITRPDANGMLLFHVRSDEMYLVPADAYAVLSLCDGSRTVGEIEDELARNIPDQSPSDVTAALEEFFAALVRRDLVQLWGSP